MFTIVSVIMNRIKFNNSLYFENILKYIKKLLLNSYS